MANTSHEEMVIQGGNFAVWIPATITAGEVSALGTAVMIEALEGTELTIKNPETESEVVTAVLDNGVTIEAESVSTVLDAKTGAEKSGSGADAFDAAKFTTQEVGAAALAEYQSMVGDYGFLCVPIGFNPQGTSEGYGFLFGKMTSDITRATKGNEFTSIPLEFTGRTGIAATGFDYTDMNTGFGIAVDPMGGAAITKIIDVANAFIAGDLTTLLTGKIVLKAAA
jgi:hypothetical protein